LSQRAGNFGRLEDCGAAGNERESSGGRESGLVRDRLLKGFGDISGAMDDTYNFDPGFHFAVVDDVIAHRMTSQAASNLVSFPARLGHLKKNGKTPGYGVNETIGRAFAPLLCDINPNVIEVGTRRL
jgi:hypothetical protein